MTDIPFLNSKGVMVDLETFSTRTDACIISIGAVKFDFFSIIDRFKVNIDPVSCKKAGLHLSADTIDWWSQQSKEAQNGWKHNPEPIPLQEALEKFVTWWGKEDLYFWCNGLSFDAPILNFALERCGMKKPWNYQKEMDLRTVYSLTGFKPKRADKKEFVYHDALADAEIQAITLIKLFENDEVPF